MQVGIPGCQKGDRKPHSSSDLCHLGFDDRRRLSPSQTAAPRRHVPASAPAGQVYLGFYPKQLKTVVVGGSPFEAASTKASREYLDAEWSMVISRTDFL